MQKSMAIVINPLSPLAKRGATERQDCPLGRRGNAVHCPQPGFSPGLCRASSQAGMGTSAIPVSAGLWGKQTPVTLLTRSFGDPVLRPYEASPATAQKKGKQHELLLPARCGSPRYRKSGHLGSGTSCSADWLGILRASCAH